MRYDNLSAFEKYLETANNQELKFFYFILGKDVFECQEAADLLLAKILPSEEKREFALTILDGTQIEQVQLERALDSGSFFSKFQVIWIQKFDKAKKSIQDRLEKTLSHPQPGQYLLLSAISWQKSNALYKAVDKEGVILDLVELKPWEKEKRLIAWVNKQATIGRKLMSYQACELLVKRVGHDKASLTQELEKLMCYCADKKEVTEKDVAAICSIEHLNTIWQLGEAIFRRDSATALQIGHAFLIEGQPFLPLLRQIRSQFQTEYQVCLLLKQGKQAEDITQQFPYMKGKILERHLHQAQFYGLKSFKQGLLAIDEIEMRAKNSSADEKILLELLLCTLTIRMNR